MPCKSVKVDQSVINDIKELIDSGQCNFTRLKPFVDFACRNLLLRLKENKDKKLNLG